MVSWLSPKEEIQLNRALDSSDPIEPATAERLLKEVKQVMDEAGVTFFLRQGTCLGAIRDNRLIPWDDDVDVGSVFGLHGFSEETVEPVVRTLRERGFLTRIERNDHYVYVPLVKESVRIDWSCYWVLDDAVFMYPGVRIPVRLLTDLKEVEFLGERFLVPNPPEEYLRAKFGEDWRVPKWAGEFEKDILGLIPDVPVPGRSSRLKQFLARNLQWGRAARVRVLDEQGRPVNGAEVSVAGLGISRANKQGVVRLYVPRFDYYALAVTFDGHKRVLFVEKITPGQSYVYRPGEEHLLAGDGTG
ncbi:MAG: LicD family protein [Chloroflexi bacterium]|nr:LicD family protein [Chloroflexota bacterium]